MSSIQTPPLRFAIIGCGRMGRQHADRLHQDGRGQVVALVDSHRASAEHVRDHLDVKASIYRDVASLLEGDKVDAAIICTPTPNHFEQTLACLNEGVHVLCEKPLTDTRTHILDLIARHKKGPARLSIAYQRRSLGSFRTLRREVQSGKWGPVRAVSSHNVENWQQLVGGTWRDDPTVNWGGFIGDAGSHKVDAVFFITGLSPVNIFARCELWGSRVEITASVSATLASNVPLTMDFIGHAQYFGEDLHIHCAEGDWMLRHGAVWLGRNGQMEVYKDLEPDSEPVSDFLNMLIDNGPNIAPPECALPVYDFTAALLESNGLGRPVEL